MDLFQLQERTEKALDELKVLRLVEQTSQNSMVPQWIKEYKDGKFYMVWLNTAYETTFLIPRGKSREDYIGKLDEEIWSDEVSELFKQHDLQALGGVPVQEIEVVPDAATGDGIPLDIMKYRVDVWPSGKYIRGSARPLDITLSAAIRYYGAEKLKERVDELSATAGPDLRPI